MKINESAWPITISSLKAEFAKLGISEGMTLLVHSSIKSLNRWVVGGSNAVVLALEEAVGEGGTIVMPAHSGDLSDPTGWRNPPVPQEWWSLIKEQMPAFDRDLTSTWGMGVIADSFRKQSGTLRSDHPQVSFTARGPRAKYITDSHSLANGLGENSPLARLYELHAWVLLLGVEHSKNTSLHLAEYRADYSGKQHVILGAPIKVNGRREWVTFEDIDYDSDDFQTIGDAFEQEGSSIVIGKIGDASIRLMPQRELVDFGVKWMEQYRGQ
jgi:aminoglycoside 3-N-acetyltransferase